MKQCQSVSSHSAHAPCSTRLPHGAACRSLRVLAVVDLHSSATKTTCCAPNLAARQRSTSVHVQQVSGTESQSMLLGPAMAMGLCLATSVWPEAAHASEGALTGQALELFTQFLEQVEHMGPYGAVLFVAVVTLFEMIPLFPTQPLSLASGLLFGAQKGALLMLIGVTMAAVNAFLISRGVGRPLAQKVIDAEMGHEDAAGTIAKTMAQVQAAIDGGGFWKQLTAVTLLRLTPVVPFSASNYLLGLTPLQFPAFLGGTLAGMAVWSTLYASLGGASRALLDRGADMESLLADLADKASALSSGALTVTGGVAALGVAAYVARSMSSQPQAVSGQKSNGGVSAAPTNGTGNGNGNGNGETAAEREAETVTTGVGASHHTPE